MVNPLLTRLASSAAGDWMLTVAERGIRAKRNHLQILTYHRVLEPAAFDRQMAYLAANYHVVSTPELLAACWGDCELSPGSVMITFDDAYCDFAEYAWPTLKRYGLPATLFVPTAFPDNPERIFWWDRLQHALAHTPRRDALDTPAGRIPLATAKQRIQAYRRLRYYIKTLPHREALARTDEIFDELAASLPEQIVLGWEALRQLADEGVTLGAHTRNHPLLNQIPLEEVESEVVGSLDDIRTEIGTVLPIFAYPAGRFTDQVVEVLRRAGIVLAYTTIRGTNELPRADWLRLRRINIGPRATLPILRGALVHARVVG